MEAKTSKALNRPSMRGGSKSTRKPNSPILPISGSAPNAEGVRTTTTTKHPAVFDNSHRLPGVPAVNFARRNFRRYRAGVWHPCPVFRPTSYRAQRHRVGVECLSNGAKSGPVARKGNFLIDCSESLGSDPIADAIRAQIDALYAQLAVLYAALENCVNNVAVTRRVYET